jgi:hypothetical protein
MQDLVQFVADGLGHIYDILYDITLFTFWCVWLHMLASSLSCPGEGFCCL